MNKTWWLESKGEIGDHLKESLDKIISTERYYPYIKDQVNNDVPNQPVTYNMYGAINENALYCKMGVDGKTYYGKINSGLFWPAMVDRIWGMDQMDAHYLNWLTDMMCYVYLGDKTQEAVLDLWDVNFAKMKEAKSVSS
jgi:hypothetical protein